MPLHILPDSRDPAADSRYGVHGVSEETNSLAHRVQSLRDKLAEVRARIQELLRQYPQFAQASGRHVAAAILAVTLFFASWLIDLIVLSPLADFMLDWAAMPGEARLPVRIAFAFIWTVFGYGLGTKLGIGLHSRQRAAWFDLFPAAAYVVAMPVIAYFVSEPVFEGPARWMLIPMTVVLSSVPVLSGYFASTGAEYLVFLLRLSWLKHRERSLQQAISRAGGELVIMSQRLAVAVDEHERRFGERVQPYLTELAQRLIQEFSRGNITVTLDEPQALPLPTPRPLPSADGNGRAAGPAREQEPEQAAAAAPANGTGASSEADSELEYLRRQLAQRAQDEDAELRPPSEFTTRLPQGGQHV